MLPWIIGGGALLVGIGKLAVEIMEDVAWEKQQEVRQRSCALAKRVEEHNRELERQLTTSGQAVEFERLRNLHYASHLKAQSMHGVLKDGKQCQRRLDSALRKSVEERDRLRRKAQSAVVAEKQEVRAALHKLQELRKALFEERGRTRGNNAELAAQLKQLNHNTHLLKLQIRDNCGHGGLIWFQRLEARNRRD